MSAQLSKQDPTLAWAFNALMSLTRSERLRSMRCFFVHNQMPSSLINHCLDGKVRPKIKDLDSVLYEEKTNSCINEVRLANLYVNLRFNPDILAHYWPSIVAIRTNFHNRVDSKRRLKFGKCPNQDVASLNCECWNTPTPEQKSPGSTSGALQSRSAMKRTAAFAEASEYFAKAEAHEKAAEESRRAGMEAWMEAQSIDMSSAQPQSTVSADIINQQENSGFPNADGPTIFPSSFSGMDQVVGATPPKVPRTEYNPAAVSLTQNTNEPLFGAPTELGNFEDASNTFPSNGADDFDGFFHAGW